MRPKNLKTDRFSVSVCREPKHLFWYSEEPELSDTQRGI